MQLFKKFSSVIGHSTIAGFLALGMMSNASATVSGYAGITFSSANLGTEIELSDPATFGWSFSLNGNRTLSSLGLYNTDLNSATTVSLWNSGGTLVASSVFDPSTYSGIDTSDLSNSGFLWMSTNSVALSAGTYTIGAFANGSQFAATEAIISGTSGLNILSKALVDFGNAKPTSDFGALYTNGLFGPNLRFAEAPAPVPVPGSVWLLGSGLLGLMGLKRAKKAT